MCSDMQKLSVSSSTSYKYSTHRATNTQQHIPMLIIRELIEQRRRRRLVKSEFLFHQQDSQLSRSIQYANDSIHVLRLNAQ